MAFKTKPRLGAFVGSRCIDMLCNRSLHDRWASRQSVSTGACTLSIAAVNITVMLKMPKELQVLPSEWMTKDIKNNLFSEENHQEVHIARVETQPLVLARSYALQTARNE